MEFYLTFEYMNMVAGVFVCVCVWKRGNRQKRGSVKEAVVMRRGRTASALLSPGEDGERRREAADLGSDVSS